MRHAGRKPAWQHHLQTGPHGSSAPIAGGAVGSPRQDYPRNRTRRRRAVAAEMGQEPPLALQRSDDFAPKGRSHATPTAIG
jgi:hypothetical protein